MSETTAAGPGAGLDTTTGREKGNWAATSLSVLGAFAMTSCCILPLVLLGFGITGVFLGQLGALYQYHWYFLAFAIGTLVYGFWKAYRPVTDANCTTGTCARPVNRKVMRAILWGSLVVVVIAQAFQYVAPILFNPF